MFLASTTQLEAWANSIVQAVSAGKYQEDDRVEFKGNWIEPKKAARRIAGAANAARGADLIWIIGVDTRQPQHFTDPPQSELAQWLPAVRSRFVDGHCPVFRAFNILVGDHTCYALAFDSEEAPFLIKNPSKGTQGTEVIEFEVPWREGTMVRSARRGELLSILYRRDPLPDFELLSASYDVEPQKSRDEARALGSIALEIYIVPRSIDPVVLPLHRIFWSIDMPETKDVAIQLHKCWIKRDSSELNRAINMAFSKSSDRVVVEAADNRQTRVTDTEVILFGPAVVHITLQLSGLREVLLTIAPVSGRARFEIGADRTPIILHFETRRPISTSSDKPTPAGPSPGD